MSWFTAILAIAGTAMLLPRDVDDRTLYTILCKPVPRFEYLLGKLGGVILLLALSLLASTFATSTLFTIMAGLALLIIGQGQELARDYIFKDLLGTTATAQHIIAVTLALLLLDLRQFNVIDEVVAGTTIPAWFLWRMTGIAMLCLAFYQILSWFVLSDKEL